MSEAEAAAIGAAVQAVRNGDRQAFGTIVNSFQRRLFGLVLMMTRNPAGAEEVVQDAFVRAFNHLHAYDDRRPFYPWLSTIAVRLAQNWLVQRARTSAREGAELLPEHDAESSEGDPLTEMIEDERDRRLWSSVAKLASGERTAVILYYRQDMSVGEIASAIGVSTGTIKTLLFRGRQHLRRELSDLLPDKDSDHG